jgi:hypothetical protein
MKRNEIIGEIKANPDYLRAAERSRSQARDAQRTFGKSPEEKAAARRKEINRDKGIAGYSKRYNKENPRPKVEPRSDSKTSSGPQDWYGQNRYMGDSVEQDAKISELASPDYIPTLNKAKELLAKGMTVDQVARQLAVPGPNNQLVGPMGGKWGAINAAKQQLSAGKTESVEEALEEGASDYVGDAIEGLRMAKPGLEKEDFLDELYSYIDAEMGNRAAEAAFADKDSYDDWYENYADTMEENAGMLKVAKDDEQQTILQNPTTGVQTQIDKKNPNAPRLAQDDKGKLTLSMPQAGGTGPEKAPNLVGKEVQVSQMPEMVDIRRLAGLK